MNSKNSRMITKPEPMFTPADVMGPRTTTPGAGGGHHFPPRDSRETPAEPFLTATALALNGSLACGTAAGDKCK